MSLMKVRWQDWSGNFAYAPPLRDAVVNTDAIVSVTPTESRGSGPWVSVVLKGGGYMTCQGTPDDFLDSSPPKIRGATGKMIDPICAGCGLPEVHKMCPRWGTDVYMNPDHPDWGKPIQVEP